MAAVSSSDYISFKTVKTQAKLLSKVLNGHLPLLAKRALAEGLYETLELAPKVSSKKVQQIKRTSVQKIFREGLLQPGIKGLLQAAKKLDMVIRLMKATPFNPDVSLIIVNYL